MNSISKILVSLVYFTLGIVYASVGEINSIKGEVSLQNSFGEQTANVGMSLDLQDRINTLDKSSTHLSFIDDTSVSIGKNSTFLVENYLFDSNEKDNNSISLEFTKGILRIVTGQIGKINPKKFHLKTRSAHIGIRGTIFIVKVDGDLLKVGVESGSVLVTPFDTSIKPFIVNEKSMVTFNIKAGSLKNFIKDQIKFDLLSSWKEAIEFKKEALLLEQESEEKERSHLRDNSMIEKLKTISIFSLAERFNGNENNNDESLWGYWNTEDYSKNRAGHVITDSSSIWSVGDKIDANRAQQLINGVGITMNFTEYIHDVVSNGIIIDPNNYVNSQFDFNRDNGNFQGIDYKTNIIKNIVGEIPLDNAVKDPSTILKALKE